MALAGPLETASASTRTPPPTDLSAVRVQITDDGVAADHGALLWESLAYFMAHLKDEGGTPLRVDEHHEEWADLAEHEAFLVAMAPRDHGKTWTFVIAKTLWQVWRHNRDPATGGIYADLHEGVDETVIFSDTLPQAERTFEAMQGILLANPHLFEDLLPSRRGGRRDAWSKRRIHLRNGARVIVRGYRTSTRGLHPTRIILDDVLNDKNTLTSYQRDKVWTYFVGTLVPMNPAQMIVVGCLATGTPVLMADSTWRPIEQVRVGEEVWAVNTRGEWLRRPVEAVLDQGIAETVEVVTDRAALRATPWHPFLVASGSGGNLTWRRADELKPDDRLVEVKETPGTLDHPWMDGEFCWLMGYLFGDGWVTSGRTSIWASLGVRPEVNDRVVAALRDWMPAVNFSVVPFGPGKGGYVRGDNRPAAQALADLGLAGKATTKRVPGWLFRAPPDHRRAFLRGLAAADGHRLARSTDTVRVEMANEGLVGDVRQVAMTSGVRVGRIRSRTRTQRAPNSPEPTTATTWDISLNFATAERPEGRDSRSRAKAWAKLGGRARFGRVVEVRAVEPTQVWDLTVAETHSFIADGLAVHNTAFHFDDLLHRLKPSRKRPMTFVIRGRMTRARWVKYRAVNWTTGVVLWAWRHSLAELTELRKLDALTFSREYQNDPVDDSASIFPRALTQPALDAGERLTFLPRYVRQAGDFILGGMDLAIGAEASSDFTVLKIVVWNRYTGLRRLLWAEREQGLSITEQLGMLRAAARAYDFDLTIVEENGFQRWLLTEAKKDAALNGRVLGHRTGQEKSDFESGVPALRIAFENRLWVIPVSDEKAAAYAGIWQSEMAAYGWKDGKLTGVGEHDDTVMSTYFVERAVRTIEEWLRKASEADDEMVTGEELGIRRVQIGEAYPD